MGPLAKTVVLSLLALAVARPAPAGAAGAAPGAAPLPAVAADSLYAAWRPLLAGELSRRALATPDDLYKFLQQGLDGPRHAGVDEAAALAWLEREWGELPPAGAAGAGTSPEPLLEPLRPDGALARINLAPLRDLVAGAAPAPERAGREAEARRLLAAAFVATLGDERPPAAPAVAALWGRAVADTALWSGRLAPAALAAFTREVEAAGWPAVHHSPDYAGRWRPHYRVVAPRHLPAAWLAAAAGPSDPATAPAPGDR